MNALLDDYLFEMPARKIKNVIVTGKMVDEKLAKIIQDEDLSKYIL